MPEHASVAVFEDHNLAQMRIRMILDKSGHEIVGGIAATREEAEELVRCIIAGEITPKVVLLDHFLIGIRGDEVAQWLEAANIDVPIIGISLETSQPYADMTVHKAFSIFDTIGEIINDL